MLQAWDANVYHLILFVMFQMHFFLFGIDNQIIFPNSISVLAELPIIQSQIFVDSLPPCISVHQERLPLGFTPALMTPCHPDLQIMVYLGILVTRKYMSWQKILSKSTPFCRGYKNSLIFLYILPNFPTISAKLLKLK